ncbi:MULTISPECIES: hypothetical protein [unclassified Streptomyces]|uniref:hypothetical protein n=1 Tax=unclassified Streptomyces TaxID=2593676 RepID=UPI0035D559EF
MTRVRIAFSAAAVFAWDFAFAAAAMRKAARQLGWKATTIGMIGAGHGSMVVVSGTREAPEEHGTVFNDAMNDRMRAALHKVWGEPDPAPVQRGSVALMTQKFRAAVARNGP